MSMWSCEHVACKKYTYIHTLTYTYIHRYIHACKRRRYILLSKYVLYRSVGELNLIQLRVWMCIRKPLMVEILKGKFSLGGMTTLFQAAGREVRRDWAVIMNSRSLGLGWGVCLCVCVCVEFLFSFGVVAVVKHGWVLLFMLFIFRSSCPPSRYTCLQQGTNWSHFKVVAPHFLWKRYEVCLIIIAYYQVVHIP